MSITNPLLVALKEKGCTVEETLAETLMGNEKLYERLLRKLPNMQCVDKMAAGDATACFEAGHEIKGVYASLGLKPLLTICSEIVETTRKGEFTGVAEKLPALKALHDEILEIIAKY